MSGSPFPPSDAELTTAAITYVLGAGSKERLQSLEARLTEDGLFRERVEQIADWLAPLSGPTPEIEPPAHVLETLLQDLHAQGAFAASVTPLPANGPQPSPVPALDRTSMVPDADVDRTNLRPHNSRRRERTWKAAALTGWIAAGALGIAQIFGQEPSVRLDEMEWTQAVAALRAQTTDGVALAVIDSRSERVLLWMDVSAVGRDGQLVLWSVPDDGSPIYVQTIGAPDSFDSQRGAAPLALDMPDGPQGWVALGLEATALAISLEPDLGDVSRDGPKGPVLFSGPVRRVPKPTLP